ncbi:MAG: MFS transporter [Chloroherpetonaceae bacterium]|nr:MFS transporter [Chloroherpetonaceae bacterium]MDW8438516.1 MFS transporter [Chloroherpetonaceae bacterium]
MGRKPQSERRKGIVVCTWEGIFANPYIIITDTTYLTAFAVMLSASNAVIAFIGGLSFLVRVFQLLGAYLVERYGNRKRFCVWMAIGARLSWLLVVVAGLIWRDDGEAILLVFASVTLMAKIFETMLGMGWMSWATDLIPSQLRGKYFGFRLSLMAMVNVATTYAIGYALDLFKGFGREADGYLAMLVVASLCGFVTILLFQRQYEPPFHPSPDRNFQRDAWLPLQDERFRPVIIFNLLWAISQGVALVFFTVQMISVLKMSFTQIALFNIIVTIGRVLLNPFWGRFTQRFGSSATLKICGALITINPLLWLFATPDNLVPIWLDALNSAVAWTGFDLASMNIQFTDSKPKGRAYYFAWVGISSGVGFFVSGVMGGQLADLVQGASLATPVSVIEGNHWIFLVSFVLRVVSLSVFWRLRPDAPILKSLGLKPN